MLKTNYQFKDCVGRIFLENLERPQCFLVYLEHIVEPKTRGAFCILENEMLSGTGIPFSKTSCIISFFPVILVSTCWILAGITGKRKTIQAQSLH
jgi:hypothetical protein